MGLVISHAHNLINDEAVEPRHYGAIQAELVSNY
jgi:hypothetical protein